MEAKDVLSALESRRSDQRVIDTYGSLFRTYDQWKQEIRTIYKVYANEFEVVWPDGAVTQGLPKIANFLSLAADDRAREVSSTTPSVVCRPDKQGDTARAAAEKRERIIGGYWERNRIMSTVPMWAFDAMGGGLAACLVWPDLTKPKNERYPLYRRFEPLLSYPDPIFSPGPFFDSFIYAYEENVRTVEKRYGVSLASWRKDPMTSMEKCTVIEYYDDTGITIVAQAKHQRVGGGQPRRASEVVLQETHNLGRCPVVGAARATMDGVYRSEFMGGVGVTNTLNRLITMMLDDAANKVYAPTMSYDVENPEEGGPGGHLIKSGPAGSFEWVQPPNQPFSNLQIVRDLTGASRAANLIPPSRSGDPNESIISAAGISASQSQFNSDVRNIQSLILSPMLEAANEVALKVDEVWCQATKPIYSWGSLREDYDPKTDIGGNYRNKVVYGMRAGLDPINQGVMALQQFGAGGITRRTLMELSPFVEDPQREEKQRLLENLQEALVSGLISQAQNGQLDAASLAHIYKMVNDDDESLQEAVAMHAPLAPAPLAAPGPTAASPTPEAPGLAGAAEGQSLPENMPPMAELLGR